MQHAQRLTREEMGQFVAASSSLTFGGARREEIYGLVERTLQAQQYLRLPKKDKASCGASWPRSAAAACRRSRG